VESPLLYRPDTPNYIAQAWHNRDLLDRRNGRPLPHDVVSLTVNSQYRRSQDQLHVHISCTTRELRARLLAAQDELGSGRRAAAGGAMPGMCAASMRLRWAQPAVRRCGRAVPAPAPTPGG
jgi:CDP-diacylglycerol pyrophosphatase